jgi:hypothetical protein
MDDVEVCGHDWGSNSLSVSLLIVLCFWLSDVEWKVRLAMAAEYVAKNMNNLLPLIQGLS